MLAVALFHSNGSLALTGHYLLQMFPQLDFCFVQGNIVSGRQVLAPIDAADLEPCDLFGVAHAPLTRVPIDVVQSTNSTTDVSQVSAVSDSPHAAAAATASPTPTLFERLTPDQCDSFLCMWTRLPLQLSLDAFDLHGPELTPLAKNENSWATSSATGHSLRIQDAIGDLQDGLGPGRSHACHFSRPHCTNQSLSKEGDAILDPRLAAGLIQHPTLPYSSPLVAIPIFSESTVN